MSATHTDKTGTFPHDGSYRRLRRLMDAAPDLYLMLERSAALHRAMVLDLPGLLADAGLSDEESLCDEANALADEIDAALAKINEVSA
jgi:hypothetical protein